MQITLIKCHMAEPHALSHEVSAFIYILIELWDYLKKKK